MTANDFFPGEPDLKIPEVRAGAHKQQLKLTLLDAQKSAALTVWLAAVPCFFLFAVLMKHAFRYDLGVFTIIEEFVASIDRSSGIPFLSVLLLAGLPLLAVAINLLSLLHVAIDRPRKEVIISVKIRWLNIFLLVLNLGIVGVFLAYGLVENIRH
jgi:hypothetical protein